MKWGISLLVVFLILMLIFFYGIKENFVTSEPIDKINNLTFNDLDLGTLQEINPESLVGSFINEIKTKFSMNLSLLKITKIIQEKDKFNIFFIIKDIDTGVAIRMNVIFLVNLGSKRIKIISSKPMVSKINNKPRLPAGEFKSSYAKYSVNSVISEPIIISTTIEPDDMCFGSIDTAGIETKEECENFGGTWDSPVKSDEDCPFYRANKNYPNDRGGGKLGGYCEMPSGISIIGYRYYDPENKPLCYNCSTKLIGQGTLGYCCDSQKYPDYKFSGDSEDRSKFFL